MRPQSWFPIVQVADGAVIAGAWIFGSDVLGVHRYVAAPMAELTQREALGQLAYTYDQRLAVAAARRFSVDSTVGGRGKDLASYWIDEDIQAIALLPHTRRDFRAWGGLGGALGRRTFTVVDQGALRRRDERVGALLFGIDTRAVQWRSEGPSEGGKIEWIGERGLAGGDFPGSAHHLHAMGFLPLRGSVLAGRLRAGRANADAEPFSVGGLDIALPDELPAINRRSFGLRGYDGGAQTGRHMRAGTIEWRVPIADIDRHLMLPPIGVNRLSATFFGEAGKAWQDSQDAHLLRSRGAELRGELRLGYLLPVDLRLGHAEALDGKGGKRSYLVMGRAF
jgi:hypothetical protein